MGVHVKRVDVVVLFVGELGRAKAFYRDTLGLPLRHEDESSAYFELETASLLLLTREGAQDLLSAQEVAAETPTGARSQLVAFVEDVDALYDQLKGKGVEFILAPVDRPWGLRTAHFKDPDGHLWEISQPLTQGTE